MPPKQNPKYPTGWDISWAECVQCGLMAGLICIHCQSQTHFLWNRGWVGGNRKNWYCNGCRGKFGWETVKAPDWTMCPDCKTNPFRHPGPLLVRAPPTDAPPTADPPAYDSSKGDGRGTSGYGSSSSGNAAMPLPMPPGLAVKCDAETESPGDSIDTTPNSAPIRLPSERWRDPSRPPFQHMTSWKDGCTLEPDPRR